MIDDGCLIGYFGDTLGTSCNFWVLFVTFGYFKVLLGTLGISGYYGYFLVLLGTLGYSGGTWGFLKMSEIA